MLIEQLERIRRQPQEVRQRFVLIASVVLTAIIAAIWLSVMFAGRGWDVTPVERTQHNTQAEPGLIERIKQNAAAITADMGLTDTEPAVPEPTPQPYDFEPRFDNTFRDNSGTAAPERVDDQVSAPELTEDTPAAEEPTEQTTEPEAAQPAPTNTDARTDATPSDPTPPSTQTPTTPEPGSTFIEDLLNEMNIQEQ